jgi:acyl-coenzyme A thioesterase PaaI-like protein
MTDLATVRMMLLDLVPFNRHLGVEVVDAGAEFALVQLAENPAHHNHVGTIHAGVQFTLCEAASGAMAIAAFGDLIMAGVVPLATTATIIYKAPAGGDLRARGTLPAEEQARVRGELEGGRKARFTVQVTLMALTDDTPLTQTSVEWILLKR